MKAIRTWIVVADGARARFLVNEGPGKGLREALPEESGAPPPPTRDLGTDRPGRVFESADSSRHAMEPRVDWHRFEKQRFARSVAQVIDRGATERAFDRLVLIAPPRTLGDLRAVLGHASREAVHGEVAKDLTKVPVHDLPGHLEDILNI
jgi:protein required for attachment to host cells